MKKRLPKFVKKGKEEQYHNGVTRGAKRTMALVGAAGVIAAAIISVNQASPIIEPYWPATHGFVREIAEAVKVHLVGEQTQTNKILRALQIEQAEGKLDATKDSITKWNLERSKTTDAVTQSMIDLHLKDLQNSAGRLSDQLNSLKKLRDEGH